MHDSINFLQRNEIEAVKIRQIHASIKLLVRSDNPKKLLFTIRY